MKTILISSNILTSGTHVNARKLFNFSKLTLGLEGFNYFSYTITLQRSNTDLSTPLNEQ
jgi:hypothetical protein